MSNNSLPYLVSLAMFNRLQRISAHLIVATCAATLLVGCNKKSGDAASNSSKETAITGKPTDAPVAITPAWKSGNKYAMRLERTQTGRLGPMGMGGRRGQQANDAPVETVYAQEYTLTITNAADGKRGAELEITGIELQSGRGEETLINYDSQNKAAPREQGNPISTAIVGALDKLVGGKVRYLLGEDGKVQKVDGIDELFARADGTNTQRGPFAPSRFLRNAISEDTFKQMVEISGAPGKDVKVGESWPFSRKLDAPIIGKLSIDITNTLRGWQEHEGKKCARVEFTGVVTGSGGTNGPGGRVSLSDGQVAGHYWYDPEIGLSRELQMNQSYTVHASGVGGGRNNPNAGTNSFSVPVKESVSMKLLEMKPGA